MIDSKGIIYTDIGGPFLCHYCNRVTKKGLKAAPYSIYICAQCYEKYDLDKTIDGLLLQGWSVIQAMEMLELIKQDKGGKG